MILSADLHTHTTASDGQYAPAELVRLAKEAGVECLAVTDHDTLDGVEAASRAGETLGLRVLRGVELGAKEDRHMHILGLGLRQDCDGLLKLCRKLLDSRNERKYRIIDFLKEKGVEISLDEVEAVAGGAVIARPHFAQIMLRHGYVSSSKEAFDRYLDTDEYQRIERFKAGAEECIQAIHDGGGKAVLAHPYQLGYTPRRLEDTLRTLKGYGLDGLECYYPCHTPDMVQEYLELARRFGLQISGGSDFHGERVRPDTVLTPTPLELSWLLA
ncbi:PHP domain-containing protein [Intestinimonas aquisgranensis]|nr:PHP domain-containing protein [Intestinimonas aquisgranensis]